MISKSFRLFVFYICMFVLCATVSEDALAKKKKRKTKAEIALMEQRRLKAMILGLNQSNYIPFENAVRDFEEMGGESVPHLIGVLRDPDFTHKTHVNTIYTLGRLGPIAKRAVSIIVLYLRKDDADFKAVSAIALGKIGKGARESVNYLKQLLFDEDDWVVQSARSALLKIRSESALQAVKQYDDLQKKIAKSKTK